MPATTPATRGGKAEDPARTRKPGSLPRNRNSAQLFDGESPEADRKPPKFRCESWEAFLFFPPYTSLLPRAMPCQRRRIGETVPPKRDSAYRPALARELSSF